MEKKMVRPYMTAEARDVLDKMHGLMKCDDRSHSIIEYYNDAQKSFYQLADYNVISKSYAKQALELGDMRKKNQEWGVYCLVLACTAIASLVALAIQAA